MGSPAPPHGGRGGARGPRPWKYPWDEMEPGDSFFLEGGLAVQKRAYTAGFNWCKRNRPDLKVKTRQMDGGVRVWLEQR